MIEIPFAICAKICSGKEEVTYEKKSHKKVKMINFKLLNDLWYATNDTLK